MLLLVHIVMMIINHDLCQLFQEHYLAVDFY